MTGNQFEPTRWKNVQKIAGTHNQYIGHGGGYQWRIGRSDKGKWVAAAKTSPGSMEYLVEDTLPALAAVLADRNPVKLR